MTLQAPATLYPIGHGIRFICRFVFLCGFACDDKTATDEPVGMLLANLGSFATIVNLQPVCQEWFAILLSLTRQPWLEELDYCSWVESPY